MARLILKSPYRKPSCIRSRGGYLSYIATREGVEMAEDTSCHLPSTVEQQKQIDKLIKKHPDSKDSHEYEDYLKEPTRGNAEAFLNYLFEVYDDTARDVYLKYIDERPGSNGLFTDEGVPVVLSQVQKEMNETQSNIWLHIISLRREDAERLGYNNPDTWIHLLRSQRNMIAQQMKIAPENFRWYAAYHNAGHHPHVHMMAYSTDPKETFLTTKGIETIKSNLAKEIFKQDLLQIYQKQSDVRDELREESRQRLHELAEGINNSSFTSPEIMQLMMQLTNRLAKHKGKKQYGYLDKTTKKLVDNIVVLLSQEERISEMYEKWYDLREEVLRTYTNKLPERIPLEQQKEFKPIRNAVVQAAAQIKLSVPDNLSEPCMPCVDFSKYTEERCPAAELYLCEPDVIPVKETQEQMYTALLHGSIDAMYGNAKLIQKEDPQKAFELYKVAAKYGSHYAEYQIGKMLCFGEGIKQDYIQGLDWLKKSTEHGNTYAENLYKKVNQQFRQQLISASLSLLRGLAMMLARRGEEQYQSVDWTDSRLREEMDQKKYATGFSMHM